MVRKDALRNLSLAVQPFADRLNAAWLASTQRRGNRAVGCRLEALEGRQLLSTSYLSDLTWDSATNGWGPVEQEMSVGQDSPDDEGIKGKE